MRFRRIIRSSLGHLRLHQFNRSPTSSFSFRSSKNSNTVCKMVRSLLRYLGSKIQMTTIRKPRPDYERSRSLSRTTPFIMKLNVSGDGNIVKNFYSGQEHCFERVAIEHRFFDTMRLNKSLTNPQPLPPSACSEKGVGAFFVGGWFGCPGWAKVDRHVSFSRWLARRLSMKNMFEL
jgi:hypothetical protein